MLMRTIAGLRRFYPYFDINSGKPANTWIDTMHAARISGGDVSNIISGRAEALLDIRLTETSTVEDLAKIWWKRALRASAMNRFIDAGGYE